MPQLGEFGCSSFFQTITEKEGKWGASCLLSTPSSRLSKMGLSAFRHVIWTQYYLKWIRLLFLISLFFHVPLQKYQGIAHHSSWYPMVLSTMWPSPVSKAFSFPSFCALLLLLINAEILSLLLASANSWFEAVPVSNTQGIFYYFLLAFLCLKIRTHTGPYKEIAMV